jgi:hypothetical protein
LETVLETNARLENDLAHSNIRISHKALARTKTAIIIFAKKWIDEDDSITHKCIDVLIRLMGFNCTLYIAKKL